MIKTTENTNREKLERETFETVERDHNPEAITEPRSPLSSSEAHEARANGHREGRRRPATTMLTRHEGGYAAQGPGFFVWDRDPAEVIRVAESLQSGRFVGSQSARFMVIEQSEAIGA